MGFSLDIPLLPEDPILNLPKLFIDDPRTEKVNIGIGVYQTSEGEPLVLNCVRKAENLLLQKQLYKNYLPIEGDLEFLALAAELVFGKDSPALDPKHSFFAQTIGGTGALRIGSAFLANHVNKSILISRPTWSNHKSIFEQSGLNVGSYPYLNESYTAVDFESLCTAIKNTSPQTIFLLQSNCHNPTGFDLTFEQWKEVSKLMKERQLIPFFDCAYHGFGEGLTADVKPIRYFVEQGHELLIAYSFSKNMALYGERLGFLTIYTPQNNIIPKIASQVKFSIRGNYSSPPIHPARLAALVLKSSELSQEWDQELKNMRDRITEMRNAFIAALLVKGHTPLFSAMHKQLGLFTLFKMTAAQVMEMREKFGIYMLNNGRINIVGLNTRNIPYVAESLLKVVQS
jgi:aspartate/tyrosine/aromatic aminotransferase